MTDQIRILPDAQPDAKYFESPVNERQEMASTWPVIFLKERLMIYEIKIALHRRKNLGITVRFNVLISFKLENHGVTQIMS